LDHYGRRSFPSRDYIDEYTLVGTPGVSQVVRTLEYDFNFPFFDAASTLNRSSHWSLNTVGHLGNFGGEGQYGNSDVANTVVVTTPSDVLILALQA